LTRIGRPTRPSWTWFACARAVDWDFNTWCYASGHDSTDAHAHLMFECLLAYASRPEGRAGLN
jgi:hypothetical protein